MKGDFSRNTFKREKHYTSVRMQQGRVQLDSDWNENAQIQAYLASAANQDIIGFSGGPKGKDATGRDLAGFNIVAVNNNLRIAGGRYYVDGILCENEADVLLTEQPHYKVVQGVTNPVLPLQAGLYLAYLDVWNHHVTALEDPEIVEVALGVPDTTTRTQTVWQVKLERVGNQGANVKRDDFSAGWMPPLAYSTGALAARTGSDVQGGQGASVYPPSAGYRRVENQLYRVEIHQRGNFSNATFKFSRDNGAVVARWESQDGNDLTVSDEGRDRMLGFSDGQWVELTDDTRELWGMPGVMVRLLKVEGQVLTIDSSTIRDPASPGATTVDIKKFPANPKIRRWDSEDIRHVNVQDTTDGWIELEDGVQVKFNAAGIYNTGDYWLIPSRTVLGDVVWPEDAVTGLPLEQPRHGTEHHYCPLALVSVAGGLTVTDWRRFFPPTTAIAAEDVSFDNSVSQLDNAQTVQRAIEILSQTRNCGCTFVALPGAGWEAVFDRIGAGQSAHICLHAGDYPLQQRKMVTGKGHITITGCGAGTRIIATDDEAAIHFDNCQGVTIRDLYAETGAVGSSQSTQNLKGTFTMIGCTEVTAEDISLKCGAAIRPGATCLSVADVRSVRVSHCNLAIGYQQTGILLVNADRAQVEDNHLRAARRPGSLNFRRLLEDRDNRATVRRLLVSKATPGAQPAGSGTNVSFKLGDYTMRFKTVSTLANSWNNLLGRQPPSNVTSERDLLAHVRKLADDLVKTRGLSSESKAFKSWFEKISEDNPSVASQGIVVAGEKAGDIRILNNTIEGVLQSIHVGVSRREIGPGQPLAARIVIIAGNTIKTFLPAIGVRERYGIFVGNCDSLLVNDNYMNLQRFGGTRLIIEGLRIYGHFGKRMIARQNHIEDFSVGIHVNALNNNDARLPHPQWLVADNAASVWVEVPTGQTSKVRQSYNYA